MDETLIPERRDALIRLFTGTAKLDVLTNLDALTIIQILQQACERAKVELHENFLTAMIKGEVPEDTTPGHPDQE